MERGPWGPHGARPKSLASPVRLVGVLGSGALLLLQAVRWPRVGLAALDLVQSDTFTQAARRSGGPPDESHCESCSHQE